MKLNSAASPDPQSSLWHFSAGNAAAAVACRPQFVECLSSAFDERIDVEAAGLIYSELISNVIRHAPGPVSIDVFQRNDAVIFDVHDEGTLFEMTSTLPDDDFSETGRGLFIVKTLSSDLSVESTGSGKCIRATIALGPEETGS